MKAYRDKEQEAIDGGGDPDVENQQKKIENHQQHRDDGHEGCNRQGSRIFTGVASLAQRIRWKRLQNRKSDCHMDMSVNGEISLLRQDPLI